MLFFISEQVCRCNLLSGRFVEAMLTPFLPVPPPTSGYIEIKALIDLTVVHSHMCKQMQHQAVLEEEGWEVGYSKKKKEEA